MGCSAFGAGQAYEKKSSGGLAGIAAALDNVDDDIDEELDTERQEKLEIVKEVYIFRHLSAQQLKMLVDAFKLNRYRKGTKIIMQNEIGDSFFVVASGDLQVLINGSKVRDLGRHAYFGERALLFDEPRTATVEVTSAEVTAWSVDKKTFLEIVKGNMQQQLMLRIRLQDTSVDFDDLQQLRRIGEGAAGSVDLVEHRKTRTRYALKKVEKVKGKMPPEVVREIELLKMNDHPFVMQLVKTFETEAHVFMLVELISGGELHAAIRTIPTVLNSSQAMFYIGSLALALEALHGRRIIYRDLKPENVMLDHQGYLKIIDFGIAKKLDAGKAKTFTLIGTPHYMAPEAIQSRGYTFSVDHWSLGVIMYELVCGALPFANDLDDAREVFKEVVRGNVMYPPWYKDRKGVELMRGLLTPDPKKRLGSGPRGFQEIKRAAWFLQTQGSTGTHVFDQLMGRELTAPVVPKGDVFSVGEDAEH